MGLPIDDDATRDPRWVWAAATWAAGAILAGLAGLAVTLIVVAVVDLGAASAPDHTNDDGTGWVAIFAFVALFVLAPLIALAVSGWSAARHRRRSALVMNALWGVTGSWIALAGSRSTGWLLLMFLVSGPIAYFSLWGLAETSRGNRLKRLSPR